MGKKMRTTPGKRTNSEVMKSVIGAIFTLLTASLASAQQVPLELQVPFNPSPTFDPGARPGGSAASLDSSRLQQRLLNSAGGPGAYLPGLGFNYPSFNQDIIR